jgi:CubicO group peptidase (beta-lactamase class C family)
MRMRRREFLKNAGLGATAITAACYGSEVSASAASRGLPRGIPEEQGVSSSGIRDFLVAAEARQRELHSFMLVRHGQVIAESWWTPYRPAAVHTFYSLSKSFTSSAVGLAISEDKLKVTDRVVSFFPDQLPPVISDNLAALEIRHLLSMSVGHRSDSIAAMVKDPEQPDWVRNFLALPIEDAPGSAFSYNTGATFMLSAIVQKICGQKIVDYLQPRLFAPLGIQDKHWETSPLGINTGGWGLSATTEALAKFGQLYLQKGRWEGKQVLPSGWVEEATSFKIQQPANWNSGSDPDDQAEYSASLKDPIAALGRLKQVSDWYQGYAYQFWRCRHNSFRGDGAFGQYCLVMPDEDAVVAITGETTHMQDVLNLVWSHLLPAMHPQALQHSTAGPGELARLLGSRMLALPAGSAKSPEAAAVSGKRYIMEENALGISEITLSFRGRACVVAMKSGAGVHDLTCGIGKWVDNVTSLPYEPPGILPSHAGPHIKIAAAGAWKNPSTFDMRWQFYELPHHDTVTCRFSENTVEVRMLNSITAMLGPYTSWHPETRPLLKGKTL